MKLNQLLLRRTIDIIVRGKEFGKQAWINDFKEYRTIGRDGVEINDFEKLQNSSEYLPKIWPYIEEVATEFLLYLMEQANPRIYQKINKTVKSHKGNADIDLDEINRAIPFFKDLKGALMKYAADRDRLLKQNHLKTTRNY
ncbi:MAG: hypothetical protein V1866_05945 [archaeon]